MEFETTCSLLPVGLIHSAAAVQEADDVTEGGRMGDARETRQDGSESGKGQRSKACSCVRWIFLDSSHFLSSSVLGREMALNFTQQQGGPPGSDRESQAAFIKEKK